MRKRSNQTHVSAGSGAARDPVFALIERYLYLEFAFRREPPDETPQEEDARTGAITWEMRDVRIALAHTAPTTLEGLAALADFLDRASVQYVGEAFFDGDDEHLAFYASLNRSLAKLSKKTPSKTASRRRPGAPVGALTYRPAAL